jgi:hypothetical protein
MILNAYLFRRVAGSGQEINSENDHVGSGLVSSKKHCQHLQINMVHRESMAGLCDGLAKR